MLFRYADPFGDESVDAEMVDWKLGVSFRLPSALAWTPSGLSAMEAGTVVELTVVREGVSLWRVEARLAYMDSREYESYISHAPGDWAWG
jgi:hypothetical protein